MFFTSDVPNCGPNAVSRCFARSLFCLPATFPATNPPIFAPALAAAEAAKTPVRRPRPAPNPAPTALAMLEAAPASTKIYEIRVDI